VDRPFKFEDLGLHLLPPGLLRLLVFLEDVDALDHHAVLLAVDRDHVAAFSQVPACNHLNLVASSDSLHLRLSIRPRQRVSGARDTIFI